MTLLTPAENSPKLAHYTKDDIVGAILYLAPADTATETDPLTGIVIKRNTCPFASRGCRASCLYYAGRGVFPSIQEVRIAKTRRFFNDRAGFVATLVHEIHLYAKRAAKRAAQPVIRLNGTSDIKWESIPCERNGIVYPNLMTAFPDVVFYDYTKIPGRTVPSNYHLTFSLSENNDKHAIAELARGRNVAVVLAALPSSVFRLPSHWDGHPVIDGDAHDYRFLDPKGGHIVALKAKGPAKKDTSGFVRPLDGQLETTRTFVPFTLVK